MAHRSRQLRRLRSVSRSHVKQRKRCSTSRSSSSPESLQQQQQESHAQECEQHQQETSSLRPSEGSNSHHRQSLRRRHRRAQRWMGTIAASNIHANAEQEEDEDDTPTEIGTRSTSAQSASHRGIGPNIQLPCGLTPSQVDDLLNREITPDDYDMLLNMDDSIAKPSSATASREDVDALPAAHGREHRGTNCVVCLSRLSRRSFVTVLDCGHCFHYECIATWLLEHSRLCPICGRDAIKS